MLRKSFRLVLALFLLAVVPRPGAAQVPSAVTEEGTLELSVDGTATLKTWAQNFYGDNWSGLQDSVRSTLDGKVVPTGTGNPHKFDFKTHHYRIIFVSTENNSDGEIVQFLAHAGGLEPYAKRLPGVEELFDVFVSTQAASLHTTYSSTRVANPLVTSLAGFIKQIDLTGIAALAGLEAVPEALPAAPPPPPLLVHVSRVTLPFTRATIAISDQATVPEALKVPDFIRFANLAEQRLESHEAGGSKCARQLAKCLNVAAQLEIVKLQRENPPQVDTTSCPREHLQTMLSREELTKCPTAEPSGTRCRTAKILEKTYDSVVGRERACAQGSPEDFAAAGKVEDAFQGLVAGKPIKAKSDATYENVPLERFSLGTAAAVIVSTSGAQRVKLDSGSLAADPIGGTLTMATFNIHPRKFDPKAATPSQAERFRFFVGACLTPEFGLSGGIGYSLFRGFSINAGYAWLRVDTLRRGDKVGTAPSHPKDPFRNGLTGAAFVGFGYNF